MIAAVADTNARERGNATRGNHKGDWHRRNWKNRTGVEDKSVPTPSTAWPTASIILGRPGATSVDLSVLAAETMWGHVEFWERGYPAATTTPEQNFKAGEPSTVRIAGLRPDTAYQYRLRYSRKAEEAARKGPEYAFHTQRAPGYAFTFTIQADSHLGTRKHCDPALYEQTLRNAAADKPDFHIDLGDTFRATKLSEDSPPQVDRLFRDQHAYFGLLCHSAPLFLVLGNHEHEWGWDLKEGPASLSARVTVARNRFYPNPTPGGIFTGNAVAEPGIGLPADYYAWQWGDALFVVLDIYRHTVVDPKGEGNPWDWSLGREQYNWLSETLGRSEQTFKFVFLHHLHGTCRGGVEWVDNYEWGGEDRHGNDSFARHRPNWTMPVHGLLQRHGVTIVFQGHDHVFAHQETDGIVYQTCPMPGDPTYSAYNQDAFRSGTVIANSGHVRVRVSPDEVKVEYIRAFLSQDETGGRSNGMVAYDYTIPGKPN
jgi:hypothetical protein